MARRTKGYDYQKQEPLELTLTDWRERIRKVLGSGGRRRVESGETFIHAADGLLHYEIYANINVKE